jgi:hypothetical protein
MATLAPPELPVRPSHVGAADISTTTRTPIRWIMAKQPKYALDTRAPHASRNRLETGRRSARDG